MMNQPQPSKHGLPAPIEQVPAAIAAPARARTWTYAPSADEDVTWPLSLEVEPWRP